MNMTFIDCVLKRNYLLCQGVITLSSGPPIKTIFFNLSSPDLKSSDFSELKLFLL